MEDANHSTAKTNGTWTDETLWHYDGSGRVDKQTYESGVYETYAYDSRSRVNDIFVKNSSNATLRRQQMSFDAMGNMLSHQVDSDPVTNYTYDWMHQLIDEERGSGANYYHAAYSYDENGNRYTRDVTIGTGATVHTVYTNDIGDKLASYTRQVGSGTVVGHTYQYDAAGRPTSVPVVGSSNRTMVWDYDSHLKTWSAPGGGSAVMTNNYNGAGTRVSSTVTGGNTQTDLRTGIGQTDALVQSDNSSVSDVNYVPGIAERRGSTWTYNHSGVKNIDSQTNGSQAVSSARVYDAFGAVVSSAGSHAGPLGYGGKFGYQEDTAGYKLLGDRWYDPEVGRFLTRDRAHDGRNWYLYCDNNPVTRVDEAGKGWHDPMQIYVEPGFKGVVIVAGEPHSGTDWSVWYEVLPGQETNPGMDVDYVDIYHNGKVRRTFVMGIQPPYDFFDVPQVGRVTGDGKLSALSVNIDEGSRADPYWVPNRDGADPGPAKYGPRYRRHPAPRPPSVPPIINQGPNGNGGSNHNPRFE